ncbi:MAG TPA: zf-HC2 domain-containing protein [Gammaproteobacteria bacterium]
MNVEMEHGRIHALLPWYANGALEGSELRRVAAHLGDCEACREELKFLGDVRAVLRISAAAEQPAPLPRNAGFDSLPHDLQARVLAAPPRRLRKRHWIPALAASFLAAVGLGVALTIAWLDAPRFQTATSDAATPGVRTIRVGVHFMPEVAVSEVNSLLRRYDAVVVRGPGAGDQWILDIPLANPGDAERLLPDLQNAAGVESVVSMEAADEAE